MHRAIALGDMALLSSDSFGAKTNSRTFDTVRLRLSFEDLSKPTEHLPAATPTPTLSWSVQRSLSTPSVSNDARAEADAGAATGVKEASGQCAEKGGCFVVVHGVVCMRHIRRGCRVSVCVPARVRARVAASLSVHARLHVPPSSLIAQVVGGSLADRLGGAPMQTLSLLGFAASLLCAPALAASHGVGGLYAAYLVSGLFAGPQQPSYAAMVGAWFPQARSRRDRGDAR
eukprot:2100178-Pleurochrysis_carterae.AAC.2